MSVRKDRKGLFCMIFCLLLVEFFVDDFYSISSNAVREEIMARY